VITVEPGLYFIPALLNDPEKRAKYKDQVDFARAEGLLDFGGVRIEDDVVIQPSGPPRNLTTAPKEIAAIEELRRRP
jgi:Xaa-Pro aminopeptidase